MGGGVGKKDPRLECTGEEGEMGIADISAPLSHPLHVWAFTKVCLSAAGISSFGPNAGLDMGPATQLEQLHTYFSAPFYMATVTKSHCLFLLPPGRTCPRLSSRHYCLPARTSIAFLWVCLSLISFSDCPQSALHSGLGHRDSLSSSLGWRRPFQ